MLRRCAGKLLMPPLIKIYQYVDLRRAKPQVKTCPHNFLHDRASSKVEEASRHRPIAIDGAADTKKSGTKEKAASVSPVHAICLNINKGKPMWHTCLYEWV